MEEREVNGTAVSFFMGNHKSSLSALKAEEARVHSVSRLKCYYSDLIKVPDMSYKTAQPWFKAGVLHIAW